MRVVKHLTSARSHFASVGALARAMRHGERGSSLMAVIGIGAVTAIVGISVGR